ncbi:MAG: hypothetical protein V7676_02965 [Parasphingorhabdus sp.]|uniref:hypothetical protein n=1 Tax=Parasphingorhabdus sp. TaxID=2709688 RepID=UPI00300370A2
MIESQNTQSQLNPMQQLILVIVITNAGGEGKSLFAQLMKALLLLAGRTVELIDGDLGNKATKLADPTARSLGWGISPDTAQIIFKETYGKNVVLDFGANAMASGQYHEFIFGLQQLFGGAGYKCVAFLPVTPHKTGAAEGVKKLGQQLTGFEPIYVKNNKDGSGKFDGSFEGLTTLDLGYLKPGLIEYLKRDGETIHSSIVSPPENCRKASHLIADWARQLVGDNTAMSKMLPQVKAALEKFPKPPSPLRFNFDSIASVTDVNLELNVIKSKVLGAIEEGGFSGESLRSVADRMDNGTL